MIVPRFGDNWLICLLLVAGLYVTVIMRCDCVELTGDSLFVLSKVVAGLGWSVRLTLVWLVAALIPAAVLCRGAF